MALPSKGTLDSVQKAGPPLWLLHQPLRMLSGSRTKSSDSLTELRQHIGQSQAQMEAGGDRKEQSSPPHTLQQGPIFSGGGTC